MSECVVRMEMPKEGCHTCDARCVSALYGYICGIERKNVMPFLGKKNRPDWCPIICALPENHGRLVDANACAGVLRKLENEAVKPTEKLCFGYAAKMFEEAFTIVPAEAERSEEK